MPYLNLDLDFLDHPKIVRLSARIGSMAPICLLRLWLWTAKYHPEDGDLTAYSPEEIESFAGYNATSIPQAYAKQCFFDACVQIGLIDVKGQKIRLHDWKKHQGHLLAYKTRAEAAAKARWDKISGKPKERHKDTGDAISMLQASDKHATSNALLCSALNSSTLEEIKEVPPLFSGDSQELFEGETRIGGKIVLKEELRTLAERIQVLPYVTTEKEGYKIAGWIVKEGCRGDIPVALELFHRKANYFAQQKSTTDLYKVLRTVFKDAEQMGEIESAAHRQVY